MANNDNTPQQFDMFVERYPDDYEALAAENEALRSEVEQLQRLLADSEAYTEAVIEHVIEKGWAFD